MIAITGASGNLGKATLESLIGKTGAVNLVAIVRDLSKVADLGEQGVIVRKADYDDPASLRSALEGVRVLLQISSASSGEEATRQETNVVEAAIAEGVGRIVYTSTLSPTETAYFQAAHTCLNTEKLIIGSGKRYTIFRNSMYHETVPLFVGNAMEDGQVYYPSQNGYVSFVSRLDIAEALANVLADNYAENRIYDITGSESFTFPQIASLLKEIFGLPAEYHYLPMEAYGEVLIEAGLHPVEAAFYVSMAQSIDAGEFARTDQSLEMLLGRKPLGMKHYLLSLNS